VKHAAETKIREFWETLPEFNPQGAPVKIEPAKYTFEPLPRPAHDYAPPTRHENPEFTGNENFPREYVEVKPTPPKYDQNTGFYEVGAGFYVENRFFHPQNDVDTEIIEQMEPSRGRRLTQEGVRRFDDVPPGAGGGSSWTEKRPLDRYRCIRARARVPRS
jgi:hypothetical protein